MPSEESRTMINAQTWVESYMAKEKEKLNKLYLSKKKDKKLIRQLAKNQVKLYQTAIEEKKGIEKELLAKAVFRNLAWLYNYGEGSDAYIGELTDWFEEEKDLERRFKTKFPTEK
jgi:isocitrate lyase